MSSSTHRSSRSRSKSKTRSRSSKKAEETHLIPKNFDKFVWQDLERLNVEDCRNEIKKKMVGKCANTLTTIEFTGILHFKNFKIILDSCLQLETLIFSDISLSYYKYTQESPEIRTRISKIVFYGLGKLTLHELHILSFMYEKVSFSNLRTISFMSQRSDCSNKVSNTSVFNTNVNEVILALFLNKNWSALKNLEVNRTDISLYDDHNIQSPKIVNIQLEKMECDMSAVGFAKVLSSQTELQVLHCYNKKLRPSGMDVLVDSFRRCGETLKIIRINYNVMMNIAFDEDSEGRAKVISHDCKIYRYCKKLKKLTLKISRNGEPEYPESFRIRPGALLNMQYIPSTIKSLYIRCDIIDEKEMKSFASIFPTLENIKYMVVHGNSETPYKLKTSWILTLIELPKLVSFEFRCCKMEDIKTVDIFRKSIPGLSKKLKVTGDLCSYTKNLTARSTTSKINNN